MTCQDPCPRCMAGLCHGCHECRGRGGHRVAVRCFPGPWVGVVGAREHGNLVEVDAVVDGLAPGSVVVSGRARGVDRRAAARARSRGLQVVELDAKWEKGGRGAGLERNTEIVAAIDELVALPWWGCKGTLDTMAKAKSFSIPVREVRPRSILQVWTACLPFGYTDPDLLDITLIRAQKAPSLTPENLRPFLSSVRSTRQRGSGIKRTQDELLQAGCASLGSPWAPSWELLGPALGARKRIEDKYEAGGSAAICQEMENRLWQAYRGGGAGDGFLGHLRRSFRRLPAAWGWLLAERRVVLGCFCKTPPWWPTGRGFDHCHRFLVAEALTAFGATYRGEIVCPTR